jgi:membrane-associated phospholipid phosphatase
MALVVGHYLPRKYHALIVCWIIGVAVSRVYLGVHLPADIIGGFAIGWASYALFMQVRIYDVSRKKS